jgi:hypothetical protein
MTSKREDRAWRIVAGTVVIAACLLAMCLVMVAE